MGNLVDKLPTIVMIGGLGLVAFIVLGIGQVFKPAIDYAKLGLELKKEATITQGKFFDVALTGTPEQKEAYVEKLTQTYEKALNGDENAKKELVDYGQALGRPPMPFDFLFAPIVDAIATPINTALLNGYLASQPQASKGLGTPDQPYTNMASNDIQVRPDVATNKVRLAL